MQVTFGFVNFNSPLILRMERDVLPTLAHYPDGQFEFVVIDNEPIPATGLKNYLASLKTPAHYVWNDGRNEKVGPALNQIYALATYPIMVYVCANHGKMFDPTWLEDLVAPLSDARVGLSGALLQYPLTHIGEGEGFDVYIQGGVFGARVDVLRRHPQSSRFPHDHADKWMSRELLRQGYGLADVPSILSVWHKPIPEKHAFKYVHAEE